MKTNMDALLIENCLLLKTQQNGVPRNLPGPPRRAEPVSRSQLRFFGIAVAAALGLISWALWQSFASVLLTVLSASIGITYAVVFYAVPSWKPRLIAGFRKATYPVQRILTFLVLVIVYYLVLLPVAIWYRWSGKSIRKPATGQTRWQRVEITESPEAYFRAF
jgi:hypothetical protein